MKDELENLKDMIAQQDVTGVKQMENAGGEVMARMQEYYKDYFKYLGPKDRKDDIKTF